MSLASRIESVLAGARRALGPARSRERWQRFGDVDLSFVERFVFVCKANVCRSAYAEARARLLKVPAVSAGIEARSGVAASTTARRLSAKRGVRLFAHQSTPISSLAFRHGDLVVCMEPGQAEELEAVATGVGAQVTLLGLWAMPPRAVVEDPYDSGERAWNDCFRTIDVSVAKLTSNWRAARRPGKH